MKRRASLHSTFNIEHSTFNIAFRPHMSHPKKKWGQHFLRNRGAVARIVEAVEPEPDDVVVEIGPGEGVLTEKLAELPNELIAVEIDPELSGRLQKQFGDRITLINEDAMEAPLPARP